MKTKIYFIEKSFPFNAGDLNKNFIAGSERILINLTNELSKINNLEIEIFNLTKDIKIQGNTSWIPIENIKNYSEPDFLIAWSDANLLSLIKSKKNFLWSHSVQTLEKFIRKKQFLPFYKYKPKLILESKYHYKNRSFITSFFGKNIIELAPDDEFIEYKIDNSFIPNKNAIFNTRPDRNLFFVLDCWYKIFEKCPNSSLFINPPYTLNDKDKLSNVFLRKKSDKNSLINELSQMRLMLNPGHKGEVYCLVAEEAREMCIPIVTMGIGSLDERVIHDKTGYIAKNKSEFIDYALKILIDDKIYLNLKSNLMNLRGSKNYKKVAISFLKILKINL